MNRTKRVLVGAAVALTVFGAVYGLAASLSVNSDTLGGGTAAVASCQAGIVNVSYSATYSAGAPGYQATTVTLGNLDTNSSTGCGGKAVRVTLTGPGASNASLAEQTGTTPTSGTSINLSFTGVKASDVTGAHVAIAG
jgi:hypothetical protein